MTRRRLHLAVLVVAVGLLAAACGVSSDASPQDIPAKDVPFDLVAAPSPTDTPSAEEDTGQVFLVGQERLAAVGRQLSPRDDALVAITKLLQGPTAAESAQGLRTAIPSNTQLLAADLKDGVLTIDLSPAFVSVQGPEQRTAVAQLVFTATGTPDVNSVLFAIGGVAQEVPLDDGSLTAQPLTRFSYPSLDPIRLPPPTPGGSLPTTTTTTTTIAPATTPPAPATTAAKP